MLKRLAFPLLLAGFLTACGARLKEPAVFVGYSESRAAYRFDTDTDEWDIFTSPGQQALFSINQDHLEGAVVADKGYLWSLNNQRYTDASVDALIQQTRGKQGTTYGLMCRADENGDGYYFVVSTAGQFAILKGDLNQQVDPIPLVGWQTSPAIRHGFAPNQLQAICLNDYLSFSVNGEFLADVRDKTFSAGQIGVVLAAVGETAWVSFDNIIVRDVFVVR